MKTKSGKSVTGKIASLVAVAVVVAGAFAVSGIAESSHASSTSGELFILFLGAIIAVQVVPCLMLMLAMFKGVYGMVGKKTEVPVAGQAR